MGLRKTPREGAFWLAGGRRGESVVAPRGARAAPARAGGPAARGLVSDLTAPHLFAGLQIRFSLDSASDERSGCRARPAARTAGRRSDPGVDRGPSQLEPA